MPDPHLQLIVERQPIVLFTMELSGRFVFVDGHGRAQMGIDPEQGELLSLGLIFAEVPDLMARLREAGRTTRESRWNCEVRGHTWEFCCRPKRDSEGQPAGIDGVALNVTQRRHIESELRWKTHALTALNLIAASITGTREIPQILAALQSQLASHLHILGGAVYLRGAGDGGLYCLSYWEVPAELVEQTTIALAAAGPDTRTGGTACHLEELFRAPQSPEDIWQGAICIPLVSNKKNLGHLVLYSSDPLAFRKHRPDFFEMLGRQLATALQNAELFQDVIEGRREMQNLAHRVVSAQEAERSHIARELHDEFGQILTCLKLCMENAEHPAISPEVAAERRTQAKSLVDDILARVRSMALELRSPDLDGLGLIPTLQNYTDSFTAQTGIPVHFSCEANAESRFGEPVETAAYRIVQEALTNVARYAGAAEATVTLTEIGGDTEETFLLPSLKVTVEDTGSGFDISEKRRSASCGLAGMRERAVALGGRLHIHSVVGEGTRIEAILPGKETK